MSVLTVASEVLSSGALAFHGDGLGGAADLQGEIYSRLLVGLKHDTGLVNGLESVGLDREVVRAGLERGYGIDALLVGDDVAGCAGVGALDNDARPGQGAMVGIEDVAVDGAGGRALGRRNRGQQKKCEGHANQCPVGHTFAPRINFVIGAIIRWGEDDVNNRNYKDLAYPLPPLFVFRGKFRPIFNNLRRFSSLVSCRLSRLYV